MKKKIVLFLFLSVIMIVDAQKWISPELPQFVPQHDFRFGFGIKSYEPAYMLKNIDDWDEPYYNYTLVDFNVRDYYTGARYTTNAIFCEYMYQPSKWFSVGATVTYFAYFNHYYDVQTDASVGTNYVHHFSLYPTLRFTWLNTPMLSMYSAFGLGRRVVYESDKTPLTSSHSFRSNIAGQITLLGFTLGKKVYGFTDLITIGTQGEITFGIGYRLVGSQNKLR